MRASALLVLALAGLAMAQTDSCVLDIDGMEHVFAHCLELVPGSLTAFYEFGPGANGNVTAKCGFKAKSTGFAGWGLSPAGKMVGSSSVLVADIGTDVVVGGYVIPSYDGAAINAANGTLPLIGAHAGKTADGELAAAYEVEFAGVPNSFLDTTSTFAQKYVWVLDGTVVNGKLAGHAQGKRGSSDIVFQLKNAAPAPGAGPTPKPVVPSPVPKPTPPASAGFAATAGAALMAAGAALLF